MDLDLSDDETAARTKEVAKSREMIAIRFPRASEQDNPR
jgi:hypothetical protein